MNYGHFDLENKEYVITRPDTPAPWANYLGDPEYGAIISNNAGGYSFVKSGANGRIIRYRFNSVAVDQPGRYIYLKDGETGDYWSASWSPVCKPLDEYKSECRHGTAYTVITSEYKNIKTETTYYVPRNALYEVWASKITNNDTKPRKLSVTGYCEFVNDNNYEQDQVNLQYTLFITRTYFKKNFILQKQNEIFKNPNNERFLGVAKAEVSAYCGDRDSFVGAYRGYANPKGIEEGLKGDLNYNTNSCGALQSDIVLQPGETKEIIYVLGQRPEAVAAEIIAKYEKDGVVEAEIAELKEFWHSKLANLSVNTPDADFNNMINVWNAYNCFITFIWSRAASFQYCGLRNGYGYRDTVQDIQGIIHLAPEMANNLFDKLIAKLPKEKREILHHRYSTLTLEPEKLKFIDRMVADSRQVALNHTAGLSLPQQMQMGLFAAFALLDKENKYKQKMQEIIRRRLHALWENTGFTLTEDPLRVGYYTEIDMLVWAKKFYGDDFVEYLKRTYSPLNVVFRLAKETSLVLLNGGGFDGPEWSVRASLANLDEKDYATIGQGIKKILEEYAKEFFKNGKAKDKN